MACILNPDSRFLTQLAWCACFRPGVVSQSKVSLLLRMYGAQYALQQTLWILRAIATRVATGIMSDLTRDWWCIHSRYPFAEWHVLYGALYDSTRAESNTYPASWLHAQYIISPYCKITNHCWFNQPDWQSLIDCQSAGVTELGYDIVLVQSPLY